MEHAGNLSRSCSLALLRATGAACRHSSCYFIQFERLGDRRYSELPATAVHRLTMLKALREYLLRELLEHPVLSVEMANRGIERRCFELIFGATGAHHRFAETECDGAASDLRLAPTLPPPA